ncbi:hypothetical protein [Aquabacterium sp.]|uniref:hypothetical protein n=1 Tax=Aquabacterium sp. TaxID=1872578 RepID=UPI0035B21265
MLEQDYDEFAELLEGVSSLLSRGKYVPNPTNTALFFRALSRHPIEVVRSGFDAHVSDTVRGQYVPNPADILAQIEGLAAVDGRPGAEEAWAIACRAADESETVVWSEEMAQAWQMCQPVMQMGDEVGARMAFKESYARQVEDARRLRRPVSWSVSLGHDASKRHTALVKAETMGLLGAGEALRLAPPEEPEKTLTLLLESCVKRDREVTDSEEIKARAAALKSRLVRGMPDGTISTVERDGMNAVKAATAARVEAYERGHA